VFSCSRKREHGTQARIGRSLTSFGANRTLKWWTIAMRLYENFTARFVAWLAVSLIPAASLPSLACSCGIGEHSQKVAASQSERQSVCSHCGTAAARKMSCCAKAVASSENHDCRRAVDNSHAAVCTCSAKRSEPSPAQLPGHSQTVGAKSTLALSCGSGSSIATAIAASVPSGADWPSASFASFSNERLSLLCRFVI
jgi:hypothetical protein